VTTRQGSRDGLAGRARRADGAGRDGDGADRGGDPAEHDDGPELKAMRAVWLTMRDEDPPERGLAELLAAAGAKAAMMQARPAWWQRLAAGMRRPQVLALATVLVLVGGAVLGGRHGADAPVPVSAREPAGVGAADPAASATPPVGSGRADGSFAEGQTSAHPAPAAERTAATIGAGAGSAGSSVTQEATVKPEVAVRHRVTPGVAPAAPAAVAPPGGPRAEGAAPVLTSHEELDVKTGDTVAPPSPAGHVAPGREPTRKAPAREGAAASGAAHDNARASDDLAGAARLLRNPPPAAPDDAARPAGKKTVKEAKTAAATGTERDKPAGPRAGSADASPGRSPGASPAGSADASPAGSADASPDASPEASADASIDQLYKQCEAAARRGDCAVVRRLVDRIAKSDRGYRARVAKDSPVGKCLAE
jgi:hypothetical protein